jgi:hypothetical protein
MEYSYTWTAYCRRGLNKYKLERRLGEEHVLETDRRA